MGLYTFLFLVVVLLLPQDVPRQYVWAPWALGLFVLVMLARYLSTSYRIDDVALYARRLFGGRRVRLDQIRRIEYAALRDLSPGGFFGGWGWRGRMWSPQIGWFDSVHTDPAHGLLITAEEVPLYVSPREPERFARELSRRVRSHLGRLPFDVGDPLGTPYEGSQ